MGEWHPLSAGIYDLSIPICCKSFREWHPLSAGIYDPIFVKSLPFMLKKAQIMQFFSIKEFLC